MKNQIKKRITKIATAVTVSAIAIGTCVGCANNANGGDAETISSESVADTGLVTYEFVTYDNKNVVIGEGSIITQEPSEDPENSDLISAAAAGNVIAPGRDYVYLEDEDNYYIADLYNNLITVADKNKVETSEVDPGEFTTELWSISYDPEKWHGYEEDGNVIINNLGAVAGSSYIEITELDAKTVEDAVAKLQDTKGKKLTAPEKAEVSGTECYVVYDEPSDSDEEGVTIFDYYLIFEKDGNIIVINESITQDPDEARAEALSYEFDDVIKTFALK